jgi:mono/diheme cytochrome c family protein
MIMKTNRSATKHLTLALLAGLLFFYACAKLPKGEPEKGKRWFGLYRCSGCHGENATGGKAPALAGTTLSSNQFLKQIRSGSTRMPAYAIESLSNQDAADIYAYLQANRGTKVEKRKNIVYE